MKSLIITTLLLLLSCNLETRNQTESENPLDSAENNESEDLKTNDSPKDSFSFPQTKTANSNCADSIEAPEICEWGLAAHDIVLLEVTETSLVLSPTVDGETQALVTNCEGSLTAGFRIEGIVEQSVNGLSGKIGVDVGAYQYTSWDVQPRGKDDGGNMRWSADGGIKVGDVIGLTLYKHPSEDILGVLGEPFFDVKQKELIRFGEQDFECAVARSKASGLTFDKLKEQIKKCTMSALNDTRKQTKEKIWQQPAYANLGTCN